MVDPAMCMDVAEFDNSNCGGSELSTDNRNMFLRYRRTVKVLMYIPSIPEDGLDSSDLHVWRYVDNGRMQLYARVAKSTYDTNMSFLATNIHSQYSADMLDNFVSLSGICDADEKTKLIHLTNIAEFEDPVQFAKASEKADYKAAGANLTDPHAIFDRCSECGLVFINDIDGLRKHLIDAHLYITKPKCMYCSDVFADLPSAEYHFHSEHHDQFPCYVCHACAITDTNFENMTVHNCRCHLNMYIKYSCRYCYYKNRRKLRLQTHVSKMHSIMFEDSVSNGSVQFPNINLGACQHCEQISTQLFAPTLITTGNDMHQAIRLSDIGMKSIMDQMEMSLGSLHLKECLPMCGTKRDWQCVAFTPTMEEFQQAQMHRSTFKCVLCDDKFNKSSSLTQHFLDAHTDNCITFALNNQIADHDYKPSQRRLACYICVTQKEELHVYCSSSVLAFHIKTQHCAEVERLVYCIHCPYYARNKSTLNMHKRQRHSLSPSLVPCPKCDYKAENMAPFKGHWEMYHAAKFGYYLKFFQRNDDDDDDDDDDEPTQPDEDNYACTYCDHQEAGKIRFRLHTLHAHPEKIKHFPCSKCGRKYLLERSVRGHELECTNSEGAEYYCDICDLVMWHANDLRKHELMFHSNELFS